MDARVFLQERVHLLDAPLNSGDWRRPCVFGNVSLGTVVGLCDFGGVKNPSSAARYMGETKKVKNVGRAGSEYRDFYAGVRRICWAGA